VVLRTDAMMDSAMELRSGSGIGSGRGTITIGC
jgi:hypothetical protein